MAIAGIEVVAKAAMVRIAIQGKAIGLGRAGLRLGDEGGGTGAAGPVGAAGAALKMIPAPQDMAADDPAERVAEFSDAVGVDEGVDHRVGVREDDGQVHDAGMRPGALWAEEGEAVDNMQRQPADGEESHNDGERLGGMDLLLEGRA